MKKTLEQMFVRWINKIIRPPIMNYFLKISAFSEFLRYSKCVFQLVLVGLMLAYFNTISTNCTLKLWWEGSLLCDKEDKMKCWWINLCNLLFPKLYDSLYLLVIVQVFTSNIVWEMWWWWCGLDCTALQIVSLIQYK